MWYLRFLGAMTAEHDDGRRIDLTPSKYTSLLAYLVLHPGRTFSREELSDRFWQDSDLEHGRSALRTALSALRRRFGAEMLPEGDPVSVHTDCFSTDVVAFDRALRAARAAPDAAREREQLEEALALHVGPFLPGLYDDWVLEERDRCESRYEEAKLREEHLSGLLERTVRVSGKSLPTGEPRLLMLPRYPTRFIGRDAEQVSLEQILLRPGQRLVTLLGTGGMGKTRLAVETAHRLAVRFSGAVCFVPLADCSDIAGLPTVLCQTLGLMPSIVGDATEAAIRCLRELGPSFLVLDNLEHLIDLGAGEWIATLLGQLPQLTLLVTSRTSLGIRGEREFPIEPLSTDAAVALFTDHAEAILPDFVADTSDALAANAIQSICERLEGIPLALELCAPWVRVLSPVEIERRLEDRFALLTTRRRDLPERHRSLHATLEWGCPTEPDLRAFFLDLSVFRGDFTVAAAAAVGGVKETTALGFVESLVARSLLSTVRGEAETRYRYLETVREFAAESRGTEAYRLAAARHLAYFESVAAKITPLLKGNDAARWFAVLEREVPNFRAAIDFGMTDSDPANLVVASEARALLDWFWRIRGQWMPELEWRKISFQRRAELPDRLHAAAIYQYAVYLDDLELAKSYLIEARRLYEVAGDPAGVAMVLEGCASIACLEGQGEAMSEIFQEIMLIRENQGDLRATGYTLASWAGALFKVGRIEEARPLWRRSREIAEFFEDGGSIAVLDRAEGIALIGAGKSGEALILLQSALQMFRQRGDTWHMMDTLSVIAEACEKIDDKPRSIAAREEAIVQAEKCGDYERRERLLARQREAMRGAM